ncbi:MAG: DoxX family membrane protein [Candidatus Woesearchaeota archaeon]
MYEDFALLLLRIGLGIIFIMHGWPKIKNPMGMKETTGFLSPLVAIAEFFGGLGILLGFLTQIAGLALFVNMLGALYFHKFKWNDVFIGKEKFGYEYPFILAIVALALALLGAGAYSLDAYFGF